MAVLIPEGGAMDREARDKALFEYQEMYQVWWASGDPDRGITGEEAEALQDEAYEAYFRALPEVVLSRCPFCAAHLVSQFDLWGFDGFWWQEREMGGAKDPVGCDHFRVLRGAVAPGASQPQGGRQEAHIGPDVPYVIPAVLELPTMVAVVSSFGMENGATAFPIAYYSTEPPLSGSLAAPWRKTSYDFITPQGRSGFMIKKDPWDFDLGPWVDRGKVLWTVQSGSELVLGDPRQSRFPFLDLEGQRLPQIIVGEGMRFDSLPNPSDEADPFTP